MSIFALVLSASLLGSGGTAAAAEQLRCFSGTTDGGFNGTCTLTADGAVLNTVDGDSNPNNAYAGVYYEQTTLSGRSVEDVSDVSFAYSCANAATNCVTGGSPRLSIPIDTNADGTTEGYAFIDAANCGQTGDPSGLVDLSCPVAFGSTVYADWAAFAAANPTYRIATDALPFVIVDQPFLGSVSNVQLQQDVKAAQDDCKNGGWKDMTRGDDSSFKNQGDCIQYVNTGK
jgi:hypothetical protein